MTMNALQSIAKLALPLQKRRFSAAHRGLGEGDNNNAEAMEFFVDNANDGEAYEPYSLAWRYLGMFMDCDVDAKMQDYEAENEGSDSGEDKDDEEEEDGEDRRSRRQLGEDNDNDDDDCTRKLLWAAYRDPKYKGGSIGEYQFFDRDVGEWDTSTCKTKRCARMDCHEPHSHWKLLGIFVESDGLYDWAEQLFKHEGVCVWENNEDAYEFMAAQTERWPQECTQMNLPDDNGNTLYMNTQPLPDGNITTGMYFDEACTVHADTITFGEYVYNYFSNYYGDNDLAAEQQAIYETYSDSWNDYMMDFKYCQPCRAYSLQSEGDYDADGDNDSNDNSGDNGNNDNDGEGEKEQFGYNCYDEAGYTNCNQCYKFQTKTSLYPADHDVLKRASAQGTMLRIKYQGKWYGAGAFESTKAPVGKYIGLSVLGVAIVASIVFFRKNISNTWSKWRTHQRNKTWSESIRETLSPLDPVAYAASYVSSDSEKDEDKKSTESSDTTHAEQQKKIESLQRELDKERALRLLEKNRCSQTAADEGKHKSASRSLAKSEKDKDDDSSENESLDAFDRALI